jgi:hypothetical protein
MRTRIAACLMVVALSSCAEPPRSDTQFGAVPGPQPVVSAIGTPFLIAFRIPVCVATLLITGPIAAGSEMVPGDDDVNRIVARQYLNTNLNANCGPPYVVGP